MASFQLMELWCTFSTVIRNQLEEAFEHCNLCVFQWLFWHVREQYFVCLQALQARSVGCPGPLQLAHWVRDVDGDRDLNIEDEEGMLASSASAFMDVIVFSTDEEENSGLNAILVASEWNPFHSDFVPKLPRSFPLPQLQSGLSPKPSMQAGIPLIKYSQVGRCFQVRHRSARAGKRSFQSLVSSSRVTIWTRPRPLTFLNAGKSLSMFFSDRGMTQASATIVWDARSSRISLTKINV